MAQVYEVQYQINVSHAPALEAIRQFQQATTKLDQMANRFTEIARRMGKVNSAFIQLSKNSTCTLRINTDDAERRLSRVLNKLVAIKQNASTVLNGHIQISSRPATSPSRHAPVTTPYRSSDLTSLTRQLSSLHQNRGYGGFAGNSVVRINNAIIGIDKAMMIVKSLIDRMGATSRGNRSVNNSKAIGGPNRGLPYYNGMPPRLNSAFHAISKSPVNVRVNTTQAESNLKRVLALMKNVQARSKTTLSTPNLGNLITAMQNVRTLTQSINRNTIKPKANTQAAINSLDALLRKLTQIKANSKITITTSAAGASAAAGASSSRTTIAPIRRPAPTAGHSTYLYPTTRQVLGPTYASTGTNVVGEMIKGMGIAYSLSALMSGVGNVFRSATAYENISQTTKNILGAHDKRATFEGDFKNMNQLMRQVGVETKFTAPQVASAGKFLAMAGYRTNEIQQSIRPISNLALIGDSDLGETADVVTNIMTGYEIPAQQMNNVADILTMTFTKSNTTLMELAESFKYAGTVARQSGLEFEQTAAAIGVLGDAGIKASHAGTTLRMMLMNMQAPTKKQRAAWKALGISPKDDSGNLKNFNTLMAELNKKSKEMSNGDFTSLFYQAFRVTAATGAMALVRHADKLQEVTDLNKNNSYGLSTELADAKKNTIEGLWYQMTSAFTESGMQGFEKMQGAIKAFLQRMIQLMKSPEFVEALSSAMQMFLKLVGVITDVFKSIMGFWNLLPNWAKDGLVYFVKIQMTLGIIAGIAQSIMSTFVMVRGVLFGSWIVGLGKVAMLMRNTVKYAVQLYAFSRFAGLGRMASVGQAIGRGVFGAAGLMGAGTGIAGAGVRGVAGAASAGAAGVTAMSLLGKLGGLLLTNPIGWGVMAASAIAWIGYEVYDTYQKTQAAIKANEAWGASYRNLGIDKLQLTDPDSLMIGNMRIFNNELLTQNERVAQSTELWKRYWIEKNGPKEEVKDGTKFVDTDTPAATNYKTMLEVADMWTGVDEAFQPLVQALGGQIAPFNWLDANGYAHSTNMLNLFGKQIALGSGGIDENTAVQLLFAQLGADPNNEQRINLEKYLFSQLSAAHNYQDFLNIIDNARKQFMPKIGQANPTWGWVSSETAEDMTFADIQQSSMYILALRNSMEQVFAAWEDFGSLLENYDKTNTVDYLKAQSVLHGLFGNLFDTQYGLFGSEGYMKYIRDMVANPTKYGYNSVKQATDMVNTSFDQLLSWYNTLDNHYKPLFAAFLNRTPLEQSLPNGHFTTEGGYQAPTKEGQKIMIDGVTYTSQADVPYQDKYVWVDKNGNRYVPKTSKETQTWSPTNSNSNSNSNSHSPASSLHNGTDQSQYKSHYNQSSAPKQVIVRIENLMRVDKQTIDMTDSRQVAAINNIKQELATALLDVVQDFNANIV